MDPSPSPEAGATEKGDDVEENSVSRPESEPVASNVSAQLNRSLSSKRNQLPKRVREGEGMIHQFGFCRRAVVP